MGVVVIIIISDGGTWRCREGLRSRHMAVRTVTRGLDSSTTATHTEPRPIPSSQHPLPSIRAAPGHPPPTLPRSERRLKSN